MKQSRCRFVVPLRVALCTPDVAARTIRMIKTKHLWNNIHFNLAVFTGSTCFMSGQQPSSFCVLGLVSVIYPVFIRPQANRYTTKDVRPAGYPVAHIPGVSSFPQSGIKDSNFKSSLMNDLIARCVSSRSSNRTKGIYVNSVNNVPTHKTWNGFLNG